MWSGLFTGAFFMVSALLKQAIAGPLVAALMAPVTLLVAAGCAGCGCSPHVLAMAVGFFHGVCYPFGGLGRYTGDGFRGILYVSGRKTDFSLRTGKENKCLKTRACLY